MRSKGSFGYIERFANGESDDWRLQNREVLDFGCGTGLLAIVAVKMGAKKAVGFEIDHQPAQAARRNVELNGLSSKIVIRQGSWEVVHEKYDLILANLVPATLFRIGVHIPSRMVDNGKMVISGFANNQRMDVEKFFMKLVIITIDGSSLDGWSALLMEKVK